MFNAADISQHDPATAGAPVNALWAMSVWAPVNALQHVYLRTWAICPAPAHAFKGTLHARTQTWTSCTSHVATWAQPLEPVQTAPARSFCSSRTQHSRPLPFHGYQMHGRGRTRTHRRYSARWLSLMVM